MRFPRNARVSKGSLEAAPWAAVVILIVMFVMLGSLLYTPGVHVQLPVAADLPGTDKPTLHVTMDSTGRLFFQNQIISELQLLQHLSNSIAKLPEKPTLVLRVDKGATHGSDVHLLELARAAGIETVILATQPGPFGKNAMKP